jgi:hypothetical protein
MTYQGNETAEQCLTPAPIKQALEAAKRTTG